MATLLLSILSTSNSQALEIPADAQGLTEKLITVSLSAASRQQGVLSTKTGTTGHTHLAVLLPGYPSVVRPEIDGVSMVKSRLTGNFLVRARRQLADSQIATLVVDCPTDSGDICSQAYQSSQKRFADISMLISAARSEIPSIQKVWLIGTSMGTVSSSFLAKYGAEQFSGVVHTASVTAPYVQGSFRVLAEFDYGDIKIPQAFIHHKDDPCGATPYSEAVRITSKFNIPLLTVYGGSRFFGNACDAFTQHGFRGAEVAVMREIASIMIAGKASSKEIKAAQDTNR